MKKLLLSILLLSATLSAQNSPAAINARFYGLAAGPAQTSYYYWVQGITSTGRTNLVGPGAVTFFGTGLSNQSFVLVSWQGAFDIIGYDILRTTTNTIPTGNCNCAIATNYGTTSLVDRGASLQTYTVQAASGGGGGSVTVPMGNVVVGITGNVAGDSGVAFNTLLTTSSTIPNTKISGLGTASTQNSSAFQTALNVVTNDLVTGNGTDSGVLISAIARVAGVNAFTGANTYSAIQTFNSGIAVTGGTNTDTMTVSGNGYVQFNQNPGGMPTLAANTITWNMPSSIPTAYGWTWPSADSSTGIAFLTLQSDVVTYVYPADSDVYPVMSSTNGGTQTINNAVLVSDTETGTPSTNRALYAGTVAQYDILSPVGLQIQKSAGGVNSCSPLFAKAAQTTVGQVVLVGNKPGFVYGATLDSLAGTALSDYIGCSLTAGQVTDLGSNYYAIPNTTKIIGRAASVTAASGVVSVFANADNTYGGQLPITFYTCGTTTTCSNTNTTNGQLHYSSKIPLVSGTPSTVTVSGMSPAFTSTTSMFCKVTAEGSTPAALSMVLTTSSIQIIGPNSSTITVDWECDGR